jgi:hypothetical protein
MEQGFIRQGHVQIHRFRQFLRKFPTDRLEEKKSEHVSELPILNIGQIKECLEI